MSGGAWGCCQSGTAMRECEFVSVVTKTDDAAGTTSHRFISVLREGPP